MIDSITRITLNLQETNTMVSIRAKRGDTGRKLLIHLSDGSIPYHISDDCYATFTAKKPDGTKINNACTIENNVIEYEFTEQTCTAVGTMKAEIRLYGADDKMITSACFLVNVYDTVFRDGDEVGSETEMNTLDDLILRANAFLNETGKLLRWQGNWDSETEYEANDLVLHEEVLYVAEEAITAGTAPGSEEVTAWVPIAGMGTGSGADLTEQVDRAEAAAQNAESAAATANNARSQAQAAANSAGVYVGNAVAAMNNANAAAATAEAAKESVSTSVNLAGGYASTAHSSANQAEQAKNSAQGYANSASSSATRAEEAAARAEEAAAEAGNGSVMFVTLDETTETSSHSASEIREHFSNGGIFCAYCGNTELTLYDITETSVCFATPYKRYYIDEDKGYYIVYVVTPIPYIGDNGNWWLEGEDTGNPSRGDDYVLTDADKTEIAEMAAELVEVPAPDSGGNADLTGYATEQWVQEGYQPKGDYLERSDTAEIVEEVLKQLPEIPEGSGGSAIIDVVELPTENIREDVFYRLLSGSLVYNQFVQNMYTIHCVEELPTSGLPATNLNQTEGHVYYNLADGEAYGYVDDMLSVGLSVPAGWYPAATLLGALGYGYAGVITNILDDPKDAAFRLLLEYVVFDYKDGNWASHKKIGWVGTGTSAEVFNYPSNTASGSASHAEGCNNTASGSASHAEGYNNTASGSDSHAEGYNNTASGSNSHAEGWGNTASGNASHAEGYNNTTSGSANHAEGCNNTTSGEASHAEGQGNTASGSNSHAEGWCNTASGKASHAEGWGNISASNYQHVQGKWNVKDTEDKYSHIVGNGTYESNRSNAHTLDWDGNAWYAGDVYTGGTGQDDPNAVRLATMKDVSFDYAAYGLPIVYLEGDTSLMSKDNKVTLNYVYGENSGTAQVKWQGSSSLAYPKKNYSIEFDTAFEAKDGWGEHKDYCLKANWIDFSHARNIVSATLWHNLYKGQSKNIFKEAPHSGAIDGFPCMVVINGAYQGLYSFTIPKKPWLFNIDETNPNACIIGCCGDSTSTLFKSESLIDDVNFEFEYLPENADRDALIASFQKIYQAVAAYNANPSWSTIFNADTGIEKYLDTNSVIAYYVHCALTCNRDGIGKNMLFVTVDGNKWYMSPYDLDATFALNPSGTGFYRVQYQTFATFADLHGIFNAIRKHGVDRLKSMYTNTRLYSMDEVHILDEFHNYIAQIPKAVLDEEARLWPGIPGTMVNNMHQIANYYRMRITQMDAEIDALTQS